MHVGVSKSKQLLWFQLLGVIWHFERNTLECLLMNCMPMIPSLYPNGIYDSMLHYSGVIMGSLASEITSLTIVYTTVYSGTDKKNTSKLRVTGLCAGNSPVACNAENVSIWWRHHIWQMILYWLVSEENGIISSLVSSISLSVSPIDCENLYEDASPCPFSVRPLHFWVSTHF